MPLEHIIDRLEVPDRIKRVLWRVRGKIPEYDRDEYDSFFPAYLGHVHARGIMAGEEDFDHLEDIVDSVKPRFRLTALVTGFHKFIEEKATGPEIEFFSQATQELPEELHGAFVSHYIHNAIRAVRDVQKTQRLTEGSNVHEQAFEALLNRSTPFFRDIRVARREHLDEIESIKQNQDKAKIPEKLKKESYGRFVEKCREAMKEFGREE